MMFLSGEIAEDKKGEQFVQKTLPFRSYDFV